MKGVNYEVPQYAAASNLLFLAVLHVHAILTQKKINTATKQQVKI